MIICKTQYCISGRKTQNINKSRGVPKLSTVALSMHPPGTTCGGQTQQGSALRNQSHHFCHSTQFRRYLCGPISSEKVKRYIQRTHCQGQRVITTILKAAPTHYGIPNQHSLTVSTNCLRKTAAVIAPPFPLPPTLFRSAHLDSNNSL